VLGEDDHPRASKIHAEILFDETLGFVLKDLGSRHGTFLNGHRLPTLTSNCIKEGDSLSFAGGPELRVERYTTPTVAGQAFEANKRLFQVLESQIGDTKRRTAWKQTIKLKSTLIGGPRKQLQGCLLAEGAHAYRDRAGERRKLHGEHGTDDGKEIVEAFQKSLVQKQNPPADDSSLGNPHQDLPSLPVVHISQIPESSRRPFDLLQSRGQNNAKGIGFRHDSNTGNTLGKPLSRHQVHLEKMKQRLQPSGGGY